jgi:hypothetical protein
MSRHLSRLFAVLALALAVVAAYQLLVPPPPRGHLVVDRTSTDFGALPLGEHRIVVARVTNTGGRSAGVLGMPESCNRNACYAPIDSGVLTVPPGETADLPCRVILREAGPVAFEVQFYLGNAALQRVAVEVSGTALPKIGR